MFYVLISFRLLDNRKRFQNPRTNYWYIMRYQLKCYKNERY